MSNTGVLCAWLMRNIFESSVFECCGPFTTKCTYLQNCKFISRRLMDQPLKPSMDPRVSMDPNPVNRT